MKKLSIASALATTVIFVGLGVTPATAAISPPEAAATVWNCEDSQPGITVTGLIGDTFTIQNTSSSFACDLMQMDGIVTASDNVGPVTQIAANTTVTFTIVGDGLFLASQFGGGLTSVTVVVAPPDPTPDPGSAATDALPNTGASNSASIALTALAGLTLVSLGVVAVTRRRANNL